MVFGALVASALHLPPSQFCLLPYMYLCPAQGEASASTVRAEPEELEALMQPWPADMAEHVRASSLPDPKQVGWWAELLWWQQDRAGCRLHTSTRANDVAHCIPAAQS